VASGEVFEGAAVPAKVSRAGWWVAAAVAAVSAGFFVVARDDVSEQSVIRLANPVQLTSGLGVEDYPTWSPDGRTIAYAASTSGDLTTGNTDIWVTQLAGGSPANRTPDHVGRDLFPSWSPDGSRIAFWSDRNGGGYFIMSAVGGPAQRVVPAPLQSGPPAWSPDGAELSCIVRNLEVTFLDAVLLSTREVKRTLLMESNVTAMDSAWSPDGKFLAYVAGNRGHDVTTLRVFRFADEQNIDLTDGRTKVWSPVWADASRGLFYLSNREGSMDLWYQPLTADGTPVGEPAPITAGIGMQRATFSPGGSKLAYSRGRRVANLWRVPILADRLATWSDAEQLTHDEALVEFVDVSPDGTTLVVNSDRAGNLDLWLLPTSGGAMTLLTTDPHPDSAPTWSPAGDEIVFYSFRTGQREIWVKPSDGGPAKQLTDGGGTGVQSWLPSWSPDGLEIAYTQMGTGRGTYVLTRDSGEIRQIAPTGIRGRWSPTSDWIADGSSRLFSASGGGERKITERSDGGTPAWAHDGKRFYLVAGDRKDLWSISIDNGGERRLTELNRRGGNLEYQATATDDKYVYFSWQEDTGDIWVTDVVREGGKGERED